jgi:hypothetical protein
LTRRATSSSTIRAVRVRHLGPLAEDVAVRAAVAVGERAHLLAHPVLHDHRTGDLRRLLEVVLGPRGHLTEGDLLGRAAAEEDREPVLELRLRQQVPILERPLHRHAERGGAARDDRDAVNRVGVLRSERDERVPHLVLRDDLAFLVRHHAALALEARDATVDRLLELVHR